MKNALEQVEGIRKRTATVFFIIDRSGSMSGTKIGALNHAMGESIPEMCKLVSDNADANLDIAVLLFADNALWMTAKPTPISEFHWENIDVQGETNFSGALVELNKKLSQQSGFMKKAGESFAPAFILMSDGQPTSDYRSALQNIKRNGWFDAGIKTAIAIGDDCDKDVLAEFTGSKECVIEVHNAADLAKTIKFVSVTSTRVATNMSSNTAQSETNQAPIITVPDDLLEEYDEF